MTFALRPPPPDTVNRPYIDELYGVLQSLDGRLTTLSQAPAQITALTGRVQSLANLLTSPSATATAIGTGTAGALNMISDTFGHLPNYPANNYTPGTILYRVTDRPGLFYQVNLVSGVRTWQYAFGLTSQTRSVIAAYGLGPNDTGFLAHIADYDHVTRWDGGGFRLVDGGGGYFVDSAIALTSGYQLCDGSLTDYILDNTTNLSTVPFTTPNEVANARTYHTSGGTYSGTINAPTVPTFTGTAANTGAESATQTVASGAGSTVPASPHTHAITPAGTIVLPNDPVRYLQVLRYFRR